MKKIIIFATMFFALFSTLAQNVIYEVDQLLTKNSIVRYFDKNTLLVYNEDGRQSFNLIDIATGAVKSFTLPSYCEVEDFEVYGEDVFFCGSDIATIPHTGILGHFNLTDILTGGNFHITLCLGRTDSIFNYQMTQGLKLEICPVANELHVLMVAEFNYTVGQSQPVILRGVTDFLVLGTSPSLSLSAMFYADLAVGHYYDDVAVSDHFVAVVGHKHGSNLQHVTFFDRPATPTDYIFSTTLWQTLYNVSYTQPFPISPILVTSTEGDIFASTCYTDDQGEYGASIFMFKPGNMLSSGYIDMGNTFNPLWQLRDITYNTFDQHLYLLQDMDQGGIPYPQSSICQLSIPSPSLVTSYVPGSFTYSFDNNPVQPGVTCSGQQVSSHFLSLFKWTGRYLNCFTLKTCSYIPYKSAFRADPGSPTPSVLNIRSLSVRPIPNAYNMRVECK